MRGLAVVLMAALTMGAVPARASEVLELTGVGNNYYGSIPVFPYYISVDDGAVLPMMCDDARTEISIGQTWTANANSLTLADLANLKFASQGTESTILNDYEMAAWIESGVDLGTINAGDGNAAVWSIFDTGFNTSVDHDNVETVLSNAQSAVNAGNLDYSGITIYTPNPLKASQEFIFGTVSVDPRPQFLNAPEPATFAMLGGGLVALAWIGRRRSNRG